MVLYLISTGVLLSASLLFVLATGERRPHLIFVALVLAFQAQCVLVGKVLASVDRLGHAGYWLVAEAILLGLAFAIWLQRGAPGVAGLFRFSRRDLSRETEGLTWLWPATVLMAAVAVGVYTLLLAATLLIPQNMDDVLTAYLPRIGYWIGSNDFSPYAASAYNSVQVSYPINAQIPPLRSIVLSDGLHFIGLDQWVAAVASGVAVYGLALVAAARRLQAAFVSLAWVLMPAVIAQAGIMLTDLVSVLGLLMVLLFGILGWREEKTWMLAASSLSFALLVGSKQTAFFMLPGIALVVLAAFLKSENRRRWIAWGLGSIPLTLWCGIDRYLLNWRFFGHPLGDEESFSLFASETDLSLWGRFSNMLENIERTAFNAVFGDLEIGAGDFLERFLPVLQSRDPDIGSGRPLLFGLPWYGTFTMAILATALLTLMFHVKRDSISNLLVLFVPGIVLILLSRWVTLAILLTGALALIRRMKRDSNPIPLVLWVTGISMVLLMHWVRPNYSLAFSRYMLVPVALGFAAVALGLVQVARGSQRLRRGLGVLTVLVALGASWQAVNAATMNGIRPLAGGDNVWGKSTTELLAISNGFVDAGVLAELVGRLDSCFEPTVDVRFAVGSKFPQGSLFGEDFQRIVVQYKFPEDFLTSDLMAERDDVVAVIDRFSLQQWLWESEGRAPDVLLAGVPVSQLQFELFGNYVLIGETGVDGVGCAEAGWA
tara:strand:+ start:16599 stop:18743 length:2145 start_codon:yes stop_codon:yes gene_type:complete